MQIDPFAPADKPETAQMTVIHKAFRREFALLPLVVGQVASGDTERAKIVVKHALLMFHFLHDHHSAEDTLLWPLLHDRVTLHDELVDTMERQHNEVADLAASTQQAMLDWSATAGAVERDGVVAKLERLHVALIEHLDLEEGEVLPLIHEHLSVPEWVAPQKAAAENGPSDFRSLMLLLGAVMEDATGPERRWFLHEVPATARPLWRFIGTRIYAKYVREIRRDVTELRPV